MIKRKQTRHNQEMLKNPAVQDFRETIISIKGRKKKKASDNAYRYANLK